MDILWNKRWNKLPSCNFKMAVIILASLAMIAAALVQPESARDVSVSHAHMEIRKGDCEYGVLSAAECKQVADEHGLEFQSKTLWATNGNGRPKGCTRKADE